MSTTDPFYDESDRLRPEYYCKHGTFIGNPYGADYICGACEMGDPGPEEEPTEEEPTEEEAEAEARRRILDLLEAVAGQLRGQADGIDHLHRAVAEGVPSYATLSELAAGFEDAVRRAAVPLGALKSSTANPVGLPSSGPVSSAEVLRRLGILLRA